MIFVTDDAKEDWWWRHGGETQGRARTSRNPWADRQP
ncbi:PIN-like domain-containing protein [Cryobacterium aureum]